jgi:hypothetical protein
MGAFWGQFACWARSGLDRLNAGHQGRFRQETGLLILFGDGPRDYSSLASAPAGLRSGECRMISVELANRLKEAGFPQRGARHIDPADISLGLKVYYPTLEELIEACGADFESLHYGRNRAMKWKATCHEGFHELGITPHEALAKLWLSIHSSSSRN